MKNSSPSLQQRLDDLRRNITAVRAIQRWSLADIAKRAQITPKTLRGIVKGDVKSRSETLENLERVITDAKRGQGFVSKDMYIQVAEGMGASLENEDFIKRFQDEYRVVRAHVPSRKALVSSLHIEGDPDNIVIRYTHHHVVSDALSLFVDNENEQRDVQDASRTQPQIVLTYKGFVFNCQRRAFLLSTSRTTAHIKEMILSMPAAEQLPDASIRGLVLTVSADEREPFAARIIVQRLPKNLTTQQTKLWEPGLKEWTDLPSGLQQEFGQNVNFGLLQLHAH